MSFLKRDEKKRLVAEIVDDLFTGADPYAEMNTFATLDFILMEGMTIGMLILLSVVKDVVVASLSFTAMIVIFFVYTFYKKDKKYEAVSGKMFLESITYVGDSDVVEQIEIEGWSLLLAPETRIDKDQLVYEKDNLFETLTALNQPEISIGGGVLHAPIIEELTKVRTDKFIDEFKKREAEKKADRKSIFKKKKPKKDISHAEDERDDLFDVIDSINFDVLDLDEEGGASD